MKKKFAIILFSFFSFFVFMSSFKALECKYQKTSNSSWESSATVTIDESKNTAKAVITSFDGKSKNNKEDVLNWDSVKEWIKIDGICPNYAIISYYSGESNGAKFYLAMQLADAQAIKKEIEETHVMYGRDDLALLEGFIPSEDDEAFYYEKLKSIQDDFVTYMESSSLDNCREVYSEKKKQDLYETCLSSLQINYEGTLTAVEDMIEKNMIDKNDSRTKEFYTVYHSYETAYKNYEDQLNDIIDEYEKGNDPDKSEESDGTDFPPLDTNIDISGLCGEPRVARTLKFIGLLLFIAKIFVPALIIIMGSIDFFKAMVAGNSDELPKKIPVFIKRFLIGIVIFFIPSIIDLMFGVIDTYSSTMAKYANCRVCVLDPNNCKL